MSKELREVSRASYTASASVPTENEIKVGSLQRIAEATEQMAASSAKMAVNYNILFDECEMYKRWYREQKERVHARDRSISNLRGQITKLKKQLAAKS